MSLRNVREPHRPHVTVACSGSGKAGTAGGCAAPEAVRALGAPARASKDWIDEKSGMGRAAGAANWVSREPTDLPKVDETEGRKTLGHSCGTFGVHETNFWKVNFHGMNRRH